MVNEDKMTRYAFISHMEDYMKKLLKDPLRADTDDFLKSFHIDGPVALKMLMKRANPEDENSAIILRTEKIKDNGVDNNGKRNKDSFVVSYKIPRKDYTKKMRNLFISLFESNIIENSPITEAIKEQNMSLFENDYRLDEGAWGYGVLDNDSALDLQSEFGIQCLSFLTAKVNTFDTGALDDQGLWSNVGVLIDFLKKYKDDELQFTDAYNEAIDLVRQKLNYLINNEKFINSWSEPKSIKSSIRKLFKDVTLLRYQKEIMNVDDPNKIDPVPQHYTPINEDGEGCAMGGGTMGGMANGAPSAANSGQYTVPLFGKPIKRKSLYLTQEQVDYIKEATSTSNVGNYQYDVPLGNKNDDFYAEAMDHKNMMKKSWEEK